MNHKEKCGENDLCTIRTSSDSQFHWENHFHREPLYFRVSADFGADNEIDNSSVRNKTNNVYKQNPVHNVYYIISELNKISKSGY